MGSICRDCIYAKGKLDGLVHSPGDEPGDAIWCTHIEFLEEHGYSTEKDPKYGYGLLLYRVEVLEGEDTVCEAGVSQ